MTILHPELSYKIVGLCYDVYNELGGGYQEKYYQRALSLRFDLEKINFIQQIKFDLKFKDKVIGKYFLDFLIEDKIVLEIKATSFFHQRDIKQILAYLKESNLDLGILVNFTRQGVSFKRVLKGKT